MSQSRKRPLVSKNEIQGIMPDVIKPRLMPPHPEPAIAKPPRKKAAVIEDEATATPLAPQMIAVTPLTALDRHDENMIEHAELLVQFSLHNTTPAVTATPEPMDIDPVDELDDLLLLQDDVPHDEALSNALENEFPVRLFHEDHSLFKAPIDVYALHQAVIDNDINYALYLIRDLKVAVDRRDTTGHTPLMIATILNHPEIAEALVFAGACMHLNLPAKYNSLTCFSYAAQERPQILAAMRKYKHAELNHYFPPSL